MILVLTDDDGNVIERWSVEHDFGDLSKLAARSEMVRIVTDAVLTWASIEEGRA